jgi:PAS domain S-box-containing protein
MNLPEGSTRIMVVDDSPDNREAVVDMLRALGYEVKSANNGREALELLTTFRPHLFLLDVVMPEMDGLELLSTLSVKDNEYEAIMMTGHESLDHARKAMEHGAFGYIAKPIELEKLDRQIKLGLQSVWQHRQKTLYEERLKQEISEINQDLRETLQIALSQGRRLDVIIHSLSEGLLAIDNQANIMLMNHAAEEILGFQITQCLGENIASVVPEDTQFYRQLLNFICNHGQTDTSDTVLRKCDSLHGERFFLVSISNITADDGQLMGKIVNLQDRTERVKAERLKKSFLSNVSHEMRTPLTAIMTLTDTIEEATDAERREYLGVMREAERRLLRLVDGILDFSKLERNAILSEEVEFNLREVCVTIVERFRATASGKCLTIRFVMNPDIAAQVFGNRSALEQIVSHLIENAVKFTERGGATLTVSAQATGAQRAIYRFTVEDTGIGIEPEKQRVIFEDFVQGDESSTRKYNGIGLGLAIARGLAKVIDGKIWAESIAGKGSVFFLEAPLAVCGPWPKAVEQAGEMCGHRQE